jgi:hypothetical protein
MHALDNFDPHATNPVLEELLAALGDADWVKVGDRNYPPHYFYSLGRYTANPEDVDRMRSALGGIPRVDPSLYDILFNAVLHTWDIVKWVSLPEPVGTVGSYGYGSAVVLEPIDVYSIPARKRDPSTLGELDWNWLRRWCTTTNGGALLNQDLAASEQARLAHLEEQRREHEGELAEYLHGLARRIRDATGYGELSPEQMASRTGTDVSEWRDYHQN